MNKSPDQLYTKNIFSTNHIIIKTLIALNLIDPIIYYLITRYFVVSNDFLIFSGWSWKISLYITLLFEKINWDLGISLLIPIFVLVALFISYQVGSIIEKKVSNRKHHIVVILFISMFILYYLGAVIYLINTSNPEYNTITINSKYEVIIGPIVNYGNELDVGYKVRNNANERQDVADIDMKIVKNNKEFLPLKREINTDYNHTFKSIDAPFTIHIGTVNLVPKKDDKPVVLDVYKNLRIRQIYKPLER